MQLIEDAWNALRRNPLPAGLYVAGHIIVVALVFVIELELLELKKEYPVPAWISVAHFAEQCVQAAIIAALQAIVFARLGRDIDRPLWKCANNGEALRRFFILWFTFNLALMLISQFLTNAAEANQDALTASLLGLLIVAGAVYIPLGACIMYAGRVKWREADHVLSPLVRQFPLVLLPVLILLLQMLLVLYQAPMLQLLHVGEKAVLAPSLFAAVPAFLDLLAFAAMWRICMIDRDAGVDEVDPYDF